MRTLVPLLSIVVGLFGCQTSVAQVKTVAADCETKNSLFLTVAAPLRMEALLQSLDSAKVSANLAQRIGDLESEHTKIVTDQIERLRTAFGNLRFELLETVVRAKIPK